MTTPAIGSAGPTSAEAIASALKATGAEYLFGLPGGGNNLDVIGACDAQGLRFVLAHTETGAAIMATAYAELSGTVGACVVTRGPGAASAINGAAQAQQDRQPLLIICDAVDGESRRRIAHQYIDQPALFAPVTKWSATLGGTDPGAVVAAAVDAARTPPRGAVHLDVDATYQCSSQPPPPERGGPGATITDALPVLARARRPIVLAGVGAQAHAEAIRALVAGTGIPVFMTYKAKGIVPDSGPNSAGVFTGARTDGDLLAAADLILAIGLDSIELIPNRWDYPAPVIALAEYADPYGYLDPALTVLAPLAESLAALPPLPDGWAAATGRRFRESITTALLAGPEPEQGIAPSRLVAAVRAAAPADSVATVDAGAHMLAVMAGWTTEQPGQVLISSGLATMAYAVPAAVGAALARPNVRVYCFVGDGGLTMGLGELETIARLNLAVTVVVFDDRTLSLIKLKQRAEGHGGTGAIEYTAIDFPAVATGLGLPGASVTTTAELASALADPSSGPRLLAVRVDPDSYRHVIDVTRFGGGR